jgi:uncharacterized glyoxalase superfamily protein PhnB
MSTVKAIPAHLGTITLQLNVNGASEAIACYQKAFGAEEVTRAPDPSGTKIWHAEVRIGTSCFFVNDVFPEMGGKPSETDLWLYTDNVDALFKRATDAGLTVKMPPTDMFWGDRLATLKDPWGNQWTLAQHIKDMTPAEMKAAQDAFVASMKR